MHIKSQDSFFKRSSSKKASLALAWIDECMMNTRWWIHMDDEIVPEVLEIAVHLRKETTDQKIIILSYNLTLKIKAMAEVHPIFFFCFLLSLLFIIGYLFINF
jgi:hypothetical protein